MHRCKYCGDKIPDKARCCFNCGNLNPYNKTNIEDGTASLHDEEKLDFEEEKKLEKKHTFSLGFKLSFIIDLICILFIVFLFSPIGEFDIYIKKTPIMLVLGFYRLVVLKCLLYKSGMNWWGVYIPIYGLWLYFELGIISVMYTLVSIVVLLFAGYWGITVPAVNAYAATMSNDGSSLELSPLKIVVLIVLFVYLLIMHIKMCDGYSYRFKKNKKFKILLIIFWPILIVYLAFNKDSGKINMEEDSRTKV